MDKTNLDVLEHVLDEMGWTPTDLIQHLAITLNQPVCERPPCPESMFSLDCQLKADDQIAFGNYESDTGFGVDTGLMSIMVTAPDRPLGGVAITKEQARSLRDWLSSKVDE